MSKDKFIDFNDDLENSRKDLETKHSKLIKTKKSIRNDVHKIDILEKDFAEISNTLGTPFTIPKKEIVKASLDWDDKIFLDNPIFLESRIREQIYKNPKLLPSLTNLEYGIIGISGAIAAIIDFLMVKVPTDVKYLYKYQQEGSNFTKWLRNQGLDEKGNLNQFFKWLEEKCKVPYDPSSSKNLSKNIEGLNPRTHRLLSLAHDPLFGLIFGLIDILNGSFTVIDKKGGIHLLKTFDLSVKEKLFAPFVWLGHIMSDMCTHMGVPIPGWGFTQILQFGSLGRKDRTIAQISEFMYHKGYDLRHFVTMSIPVAVIEIIIRAYHYLSGLENKKQMESSVSTSLMSKEFAQVESNLKIHKMLFLTHSVAASGNAMKVFAYAGNPLAINAEQWMLFLQESIKMAKAITRDKISEKIIKNRRTIDDEWKKIKDIKIGQFGLLKQDSSIYYEIYN